MNYVVLQEDEFRYEYCKAFEKQTPATDTEKKRFRDEVSTVQGAIEDALAKKWDKADDFNVGWDFDYCRHACGGIYSDRIFCKDYVKVVGKALRSVDPKGRWTYHTVCEILVNPNAKTIGEATEDRGEFFIRGNTCYINGSTMKSDWRARLGCPN